MKPVRDLLWIPLLVAVACGGATHAGLGGGATTLDRLIPAFAVLLASSFDG